MRKLTLAAVTAAHLIVIVWIDHATRARKLTAREEPPPLLVFFLPARRQTQTAAPKAGFRPQQSRPVSKALEKPPAPSPPSSTAITDWAEEAREAAESSLKGERAKSEMRAFEHHFAEPEKAEKPGVFGAESRNHRKGLIEPGEGGSERHWVTDNCYFEFARGAPPPPPMAGGVRTMHPTCKPPPTGGGEHLFDQLKPEYLKHPPEPAH